MLRTGKQPHRLRIIFAVISIRMFPAILITLGLSVFVAAGPSLSLDISGPTSINGVGHFKVVAALTNTGDETVRVLNDPNGPLSNLPTANTFTITGASGITPTFEGIKVKYVPSVAVAAEGFTTLTPGQSVEVEHNLSEAYNFTLSGAGTYEVQPNNLFYIVNDDSSLTAIYAEILAGHTAELSGRLAVARPSVQRRATFNSCTQSQRASIASAIPHAQNYAASTYSYTNGLTSGTSRYETWFGAYSRSSHRTVLSHFSQINKNDFSTFAYDCAPCEKRDIFAFVFANEFGVIHLCNAFWRAPTFGFNSKAGTLIHEASHFTVNGGTDDFNYTQPGAQWLATHAPAKALMNADNHEYFAENDPALP